jgi:hypothetical protein
MSLSLEVAPLTLVPLSGLSRVLRKVALFDCGKHRNNPTRHMIVLELILSISFIYVRPLTEFT